MIFVKSQRSDEDSSVILSQHRATITGLTSAYNSYQWWCQRLSKVYPTKTCQMNLWMEYRRLILDPNIVCAAINGDLGQWVDIRNILDEFTIDEVVKSLA